MALNQGRKVIRRGGQKYGHDLAANAQVFQGGLVVLKSGYAIAGRAGIGADNAAKAADAATLQAVGIAEETVTGGPTDGAKRVTVEAGEFFFDNLGGDPVSRADIGKPCFIADDETVARTSPNNTRARAGIVVDVEGAGVWVRVGAGA